MLRLDNKGIMVYVIHQDIETSLHKPSLCILLLNLNTCEHYVFPPSLQVMIATYRRAINFLSDEINESSPIPTCITTAHGADPLTHIPHPLRVKRDGVSLSCMNEMSPYAKGCSLA
ncbi:unnamed protein product [Periconia digitata]|uniref:Uncharacterized protein n=1 Tax=Periconia digitata TaxID=1303443 RepID=A0A9W4UGL2_9PLEO|nr:unnamed protein product [Periconia digitata]